MKRYENDPRQIRVHYFSKCATCSTTLKKGADAYYFPATRKVFCLHCGETSFNAFISSAIDEEFYQSQYR